MKYVILLGDGMADYPIEKLGGKTPIAYANTPNMDRIACEGTSGLIDTIPKGMVPGSDVANLAVMGYDPLKYHTGRGPLEAASMGITLKDDDIAFRCNLVTLEENNDIIMADFTAGHIDSVEAAEIIYSLDDALGSSIIKIYPGVGYRHLLVWRGGPRNAETTPPHDISGQKIAGYLPAGERGAEVLRTMRDSQELLKNHPVNIKRSSKGQKTANSIWLWGQGSAPKMKPMTEKYGISGGVISAVDLLKGIGAYAGLEIINVEGATGYTDTNYAGKARKAIDFLKEHDFVFIHVEAPDEMGHEGDLEGKIAAIEDFDKKVVGTVLDSMPEFGDFRVMVSSDHPTPISLRTHVSDPSPFAVYSSESNENMCNVRSYSEKAAKEGKILISPGHVFMDGFMKDWRAFIERARK